MKDSKTREQDRLAAIGLRTLLAVALGSIVIMGCEQQPPTVVTTPGDRTIIHEDNPPKPNVTVVNPPPVSSSHTHTETHTDNVNPPTSSDDTSSSTSTTTTTSGSTGG